MLVAFTKKVLRPAWWETMERRRSPNVADDTEEAQAIAERLRSAFEQQDLGILAGVLDPDVRWGGEEARPRPATTGPTSWPGTAASSTEGSGRASPRPQSSRTVSSSPST